MKQLYRLAIAAFLAYAPTAAFAESFVTDEGLAFDLDAASSTATFMSLSGEAATTLTDLAIPATVTKSGKDYKVTSLAANCCDNNPALRTVSLGENVAEIGNYAFRNCTAISSLTLNEGLQTIGESSFYKCTSLQNLVLPATLTSIGDLAFYGASAIQEVTLPASMEKVGIGCFATCRSIKSFTVAEGNKSFTTQDGVLFDKDKSLLLAYPIGNTTNTYTIPASVKTIAPHSMRGSSYLTTVNFNEGLDSIGSSAFTQDRLTSVSLPSTLRAIGFQAFTAMPSVTSYSVASGNTAYKTVDGMLLTADGKRLLFGVGNMSDVVVPEGVEEVAGYSFYGFYSVKSLKLASTTTKVGDCAFYSNSILSSVDFGPALESIGETAFRRCNMLTSLSFPTTLKEIGRTAFAESVGFEELELNEGLVHLGEMAFARCYGLKKLTLPGTIETMDYGVFVYCNQLEEVVINEGLKGLGNGCFNECLKLEKINFPTSLETIGEFAFALAGLTEIEFNEGLKSIGAAAFEFGKFKFAILPSTLETIGEFAFAWNYDLLMATTGGAVEIGNFAFAGCMDLTLIELNEGLVSIGDGAFGSCENFQEIVIPETVEYIGAECFAEDKSLREIKMKPVVPPTCGGDLFSVWFDGYKEVTLTVPGYSYEAYVNDAIWSKFFNIEADWVGAEETSVETPEVKDVYTLDGTRVSGKPWGICLMRMSDGSVRKVMVK